MTDFQLNDHAWLKDIFQIKDLWIPANYHEENMSGLMRTSSRSESENYFFVKFCNATFTLVKFLAHFETALEHQRHEHQKSDHDCRYISAKIMSNYTLEKQAHEIYTRTIFFDVQMEIQQHFTTALPEATNSCKRFEQFGLLCCHIFKVLHIGDIRVFLRQYINRRWTKEAISNSPMRSVGFDEPNIDKTIDVYRVVRDINIAHDHIINKLVTDMEKFNKFRDYVNDYKFIVNEVTFDAPRPSRRDRFKELIGVPQPDQINIRAPIGVRNKGCGLPIRYRSLREQEIGKSKLDNPQRTCRICKQPGHDARNQHKYAITGDTSAAATSSQVDEMEH
ncbi:protein FAR1-RELATED SEQUENCE 5-like [Bidens hawaiensis]|uniref:protein FAR1-RELATED SEQUENCE 5-like n=1 Tax=Bidens hawaiensis TaxID=980011 RepID=UPI00404A644C